MISDEEHYKYLGFAVELKSIYNITFLQPWMHKTDNLKKDFLCIFDRAN